MLDLFLRVLQLRDGVKVRVVVGFAGALDRLLLECPAEGRAALLRSIARRDRRAARQAGAALLRVVEDGAPAAAADLGDESAPRLERLRALIERIERRFDRDRVSLSIDLAEFAEDTLAPELQGATETAPYYDGLMFRAYADGTALTAGRRRPLRSAVPAAGRRSRRRWDSRVSLDRCWERRNMMRLALPKGRNLEPALDAFRAVGVELHGFDDGGRKLRSFFEQDELEVLLLKDWDLPLYVEYGVADFGIVGSDVLAEMDGDLLVPARLREGRCRMSLIGPEGSAPQPGSQVRLATKYPKLARRMVASRPWGAEIVRCRDRSSWRRCCAWPRSRSTSCRPGARSPRTGWWSSRCSSTCIPAWW